MIENGKSTGMVTAIGYYPDGMFPLQTDTIEPQELHDRIRSIYKEKGTPQFIMVLRNGTSAPMEVVSYQYGVDYFERVDSLEGVTQTIVDWLNNGDEDQLLRVLKMVTGVENAKIIKGKTPGEEPRIAYNVP